MAKFFPALDERDWQEVSRQAFPAGEPDDVACTVRVLRRRSLVAE